MQVRMLGILSCACASLIALGVFAQSSAAFERRPAPAYHSGPIVQEQDIASLALSGQRDLPQFALSELRIGSSKKSNEFADFEYGFALRQRWEGPPNDQGQVDSTVEVSLVIAEIVNQTVGVAQKEAGRYEMVIPEITGEIRVAKFADRAWCAFEEQPGGVVGSGHLIFIRGNVSASVSMYQRSGTPVEKVFALAEQLGRRIDAARAGKPEPAAILPISCEEMHIAPATVWTLPFRDAMLGKPESTVVMRDGNGIPRAIPAEKTADGDYMVPLDALFVVTAERKTGAKVEQNNTGVTLAGKAVAFTKDQTTAMVGGQSVTLKHPVEVRIYGKVGTRERPVTRDKQTQMVWVPLSILEQVTGKKLTWSTEAGRATARF